MTNVDNLQSLEELTKTLAQSINANPEPLLKKYKTFLEQSKSESPSPSGISVQRLILGGVALSAFFGSISSMLLLFSDDRCKLHLTS